MNCCWADLLTAARGLDSREQRPPASPRSSAVPPSASLAVPRPQWPGSSRPVCLQPRHRTCTFCYSCERADQEQCGSRRRYAAVAERALRHRGRRRVAIARCCRGAAWCTAVDAALSVSAFCARPEGRRLCAPHSHGAVQRISCRSCTIRLPVNMSALLYTDGSRQMERTGGMLQIADGGRRQPRLRPPMQQRCDRINRLWVDCMGLRIMLS